MTFFFPRGFLLLTCGLVVSASPPKNYISASCDTTINVYSSVRIKLTSIPPQNPCNVTFIGMSSYHDVGTTHLSARFLSISLDYYNLWGKCFYTADILDSDGSMLTKKDGTCGDTVPNPAAYTSSGRTLQVRFKSPKSDTTDTGSFDILITRYSLGNCGNNEFKCHGSSRCVSNNVTCDGYKDCPDNSDEITDVCGFSPKAILGVVVTCVAVVILFVVIALAVHRRRKHGFVFRTTSVPYRRSFVTNTSANIVTPPPYGNPPPYEETKPAQVPGAV